MLSEVTISFAGHTHTFPSLYLVAGSLVVLLVFGLIVASATAGRIKQKQSDATELFAIQLERIGDALDRMVSQNAVRATNEPTRRPEVAPPGRVPVSEATEPISSARTSELFPSEKKEQPAESVRKGTTRPVAYSIFGR
jgi:hypothetical protein